MGLTEWFEACTVWKVSREKQVQVILACIPALGIVNLRKPWYCGFLFILPRLVAKLSFVLTHAEYISSRRTRIGER